MMRRAAFGSVLIAAWCAAAPGAASGAGVAEQQDARVRDAALKVYVHGMTAEIADREVGRNGIAELLRLLNDPPFPRRDNVVAFLAYLGGRESTEALLRWMTRPTPLPGSTEDARALLLVPHALGHIGARGDASAVDALLAMTAERAGPAARKLSPELREAAVFGLGIAETPAAHDRLVAIAEGRVVPDPAHPELAASARLALDTVNAPPAEAGVAAAGVGAAAPDPAQQSHAHRLTFLNHASVVNPMTIARLDAVLADGTLRVATGSFDVDVPCCAIVSRQGNGGTFGTAGDGRNTINDSATLTAVLGQGGARVKVVSVINYCGGNGTNIIGCSYAPGPSMVLVRLSSLAYEAVVWVHEYGHNLGLGHQPDGRMIMAAADNGANVGLTLADCSAFHTPAPSANALIAIAGSCTDDGDSFADPVDNCPLVANQSQADVNGDGVGDACESNASFADIDGSGRVDGFDLARLGRAFGALLGSARYDLAADLDHNGVVDGTDLALFAPEFGD